MSNNDKASYTCYAEKLKQIIRENVNKNYEKAMVAIAAFADLSYGWNQFYTDKEIENIVCSISEEMLDGVEEVISESKTEYESSSDKSCNENRVNDNTVLFYDGFGLDTRGLAAIYAKALVQLGYKIVWVTTDKAKGKIPTIEKLLKKGHAEIVYINMEKSYTLHVEELSRQFEKYKPARAFFYTTPDDVSAEVVFYHYRNCVKRYQINLTDHAYWLGLNAFDYCLEFRDYGAGITRVKRKVSVEKIVRISYYPLIDKSLDFQGFPFKTEGKKILFSGGSLYKTIGGGNKFYKIVEQVLNKNKDTLFLYAGCGDDSELKKLAMQFEGRVYHIQERKDLFALMEHVDVYLNTYPMIGGLMTQYAAMAGKPPLILNDTDNQDESGILIDQDGAGIEFDSIERIVNEINHLLSDEKYRKRRGEEIKNRVISEDAFTKMLSDIMNGKAESRYAKCPDTEGFQHEYVNRFSKKTIVDAVAKRKNKSLVFCFPKLFATKVINKYLK